jgi:hypothetical protein
MRGPVPWFSAFPIQWLDSTRKARGRHNAEACTLPSAAQTSRGSRPIDRPASAFERKEVRKSQFAANHREKSALTNAGAKSRKPGVRPIIDTMSASSGKAQRYYDSLRR